MKKNIILTLVAIIIFSCTKDNTDDKPITRDSLFGVWQLKQIGSAFGWLDVDNGYTYSLNTDGSFLSTRYQDCGEGTFTYTNEELTLVFNCGNIEDGDPNGTFVEAYYFENNFLYLTPTYRNCDEGCFYEFEKIEDF